MRNFNLKFLSVLMIALILGGCSNNATKKTEDQYINDAKAKLDEKKFDEAIVEYREYLKAYPKSDKAVFAYNQIAGIQIDQQKNPQEGIKTYQEMAEKFPGTKDAKQALFMVAFMYDETLKDKENAIKSYKLFLEKYPTDTDANDKMSESARTMLEVLQSGKSIEEMIQQNINKMGNSGSKDTVKLDVKETAPDVNSKKIETTNPNSPDKDKSDEKTKETEKK